MQYGYYYTTLLTEPPGGFRKGTKKHRLETLNVTVDGVAINHWYDLVPYVYG